MDSVAIGVDIGGSSIKVAAVDLTKGALASARLVAPTPEVASPAAVGEIVHDLVNDASMPVDVPVGIGFPGVIKSGLICTATNLGETWVGIDINNATGRAVGRPTAAVNDADAAGLAEMRFGAGRGVRGLVIMVTLGTGIGTGVFHDGRLVPNAELGHIEVRGVDAETRAAASIRDSKKLSWVAWSRRVEEYLDALDRLLWPDLVIIGGGVSAEPEKFLPLIKVRPQVVPAVMGNDAGIVGAALWGFEGDEC